MTRPDLQNLDPDVLARRSLRNHRLFASGLLVLMAALTIATYFAPRNWWSGLLEASARAGFIGGIADWFAVTALFRHPLGIPIPHTAIIPNQRGRLGQALGRFVANHVFTSEEVSIVLRRRDLQRWRCPGCCPRCSRAWRMAAHGGFWLGWCRASSAGRPVAGSWRVRCTVWWMGGGTRRCLASSSVN